VFGKIGEHSLQDFRMNWCGGGIVEIDGFGHE